VVVVSGYVLVVVPGYVLVVVSRSVSVVVSRSVSVVVSRSVSVGVSGYVLVGVSGYVLVGVSGYVVVRVLVVYGYGVVVYGYIVVVIPGLGPSHNVKAVQPPVSLSQKQMSPLHEDPSGQLQCLIDKSSGRRNCLGRGAMQVPVLQVQEQGS